MLDPNFCLPILSMFDLFGASRENVFDPAWLHRAAKNFILIRPAGGGGVSSLAASCLLENNCWLAGPPLGGWCRVRPKKSLVPVTFCQDAAQCSASCRHNQRSVRFTTQYKKMLLYGRHGPICGCNGRSSLNPQVAPPALLGDTSA